MSIIKVILTMGLLTGLSAVAQDSAQPPASTGSSQSAAHPRHAQADQADRKLKRLSKRLDLTSEQQEKIRPVLQDEERQMNSLDGDTSLTPQQKRAKMREIRMSSKSQIAAVLTPEQKEKIHGGGMHGGGNRRMRNEKGTTGTADNPPPQQ